MKQETLKKLHGCMVDIMIEMDRICTVHGLSYYLIGGTLLGAVRHRGFIPWDDDLDIVMPRADYEKFEKLCEDELDGRFFLHSVKTDPSYPMPMPKLKLMNTAFEDVSHGGKVKYECIYIDIFPLDDVPKEKSIGQTIQAKLQGTLGAVRAAKAGLYEKDKFSRINKMAYAVLKAFSNVTLYKWQTKIQKTYSRRDCEYYVNFASQYGYLKQTIAKEKYEPARKLEFEGQYFMALNDYEFFLKRIYGDTYMQLPPENKRITHNPKRLSFDLKGPDEVL